MKKKLLILLACFVAVIGVFFGIYMPDSDINNTIDNIEDKIIEEVKNTDIIVSEEAEEIVRDTIQATEEGEDLSTTEIIESSEAEEQNVTDEGALETDAVVEQENISYDGVNTGNGLSLLGSYQGLTYYSQADSRWANTMYSSIGDRSQTMKSSACGPTSAAMVVSSSKGTILPTTMANLFVNNGYRTSNNGTAWAAFPFVADYFNFNEYHTTSNFNTMISYLSQKNSNGSSKYYVVASCASGLFTSGGHYIVLIADNGGTITVYDPYLYAGKFTTASRRAAGAVVSGNSVFVSENSFKTYANYRNFWIFSNDSGSGNTNTNTSTTNVNYIRYVATQSSNLNVRSGAGTNCSVITSLKKGTAVSVSKTSGDWSYITSPATGWVSSQYLSSSAINNTTINTNTTYKTNIGSYYKLKNNTVLYSNSTMKGTAYTYLAQTQIKVLSNINSEIDYVQVVKTGRKGYIYRSNYNNSVNVAKNATISNTVGKTYKLKTRTILYKNLNLTGIKYTYLPGTTIKIIKNINDNVDYVYIPATKRYAYIRK